MTHAPRLIRVVGLIALIVSTVQMVSAGQVLAQAVSCADYSSASTAQFALEINPNLASALDPDGNGTACDDEDSGESGSSGTDRGASDLQLPDIGDPAPTPSGQQGQTDVDAIDQQPTDASGGLVLPTQPATDQATGQQGTQELDGRVGSNRTAWEAIYGAPFNEEVGSRPEIVLTDSGPLLTSSSFITLWFNDQAFIILLSAETSWSGPDVAAIIQDLLPSDITTIPDGEILNDDSVLIPMFSDQLAPVIPAENMADSGAPGVPGDLYLLLITDGGERAVEIEIGIGNGDNVREDINGDGATTTAPALPTDTTTITGDASSFLLDTRTEVDRLLADYDEFMAIMEAGTFTDPEFDRITEILGGWIELDTSLPAAPPEQAAMAAQLQQVRTDLATAALLLVTELASGGENDAAFDESFALLLTVHDSLLDLDQQLTALGI